VSTRRLGFAESKKKKRNIKFGSGFKGAITTNRGLVHLNKKPPNGLETLGKG
jgi:hypothetical protein